MKVVNWGKIMRQVDIKRKREALSWFEVSMELNFKTDSTVHNMRRGDTNHRADRLVAVLLWLGTTDFEPYLMDSDEDEL